MLNDDEILFVEKYRPRKISECILPERILQPFKKYAETQQVPNLLLTGSAGVGKTTVALALCEEIGLNYLFINSSKDRGIDTLRNKINTYASTVSLTGGQKVIILDEGDGITAEAQAALRGAIEQYSSNCTFIITCNFKAKIIDAIQSRCVNIDFRLEKDEKQAMVTAFFKRVQEILTTEKIAYDKAVIAAVISKFFPDYRRTLNELQHLATFGKIDNLSNVSDVRSIKELFDHLKGKKFSLMRKWVVENSDIDASRIYKTIYDNLNTYLQPSSIPQAIIILARYQYQAAFVADAEVNLVAALTELMIECQYV